MRDPQGSLLDLIEPDVVHALLPNMWFACGGTFLRDCTCGCALDHRPGRWVLRRTSTEGVTCADCLRAMRAR